MRSFKDQEEEDNMKRLFATECAKCLFETKNLAQMEILFDCVSFYYSELSKQQAKRRTPDSLEREK